MYTNPDGAFRRYDALEFVATKRYRETAAQLQGSFLRVGHGRRDNRQRRFIKRTPGLNDTGNVQGTFSPGVYMSPNSHRTQGALQR